MYDAMVPCKGCNNKVPASSLKMDLDIGKMVCPDCVKNKKIHKEIEQEAFHKKWCGCKKWDGMYINFNKDKK